MALAFQQNSCSTTKGQGHFSITSKLRALESDFSSDAQKRRHMHGAKTPKSSATCMGTKHTQITFGQRASYLLLHAVTGVFGTVPLERNGFVED
eukprot:442152-Heterocapsa_arctica.AAC.1